MPTARKSALRAAIYLRVSTKDGSQDTKNQRRQLEELAKDQKLEIVKIYEDHKSGKNADRAAFQRMFRDAAGQKFDVVLFWGLDRFSREGTLDTLTHLESLSKLDVSFISYCERYLDTCGMMRDVIIALLATLAKQERVRLSERTKAALDRKRQEVQEGVAKPGLKGYLLGGRPKIDFDVQLALRMRREDGYSYRALAEYFGVSSHVTIANQLRPFEG